MQCTQALSTRNHFSHRSETTLIATKRILILQVSPLTLTSHGFENSIYTLMQLIIFLMAKVLSNGGVYVLFSYSFGVHTLSVNCHEVNAHCYPVWSLLACDHLAIMASSVSSEHMFSSARITISKHRNRLKGDIVEALQCLKCLLCHNLIC